MKNIIASLFACVIIACSFVSCKKNKAVDCSSTLINLTNAGKAYNSAQSSTNCKTYKAALQDYLNSDCASGLSAEEKSAFQASLNALTCE